MKNDRKRSAETETDDIQSKFESLPLEEKVSNLFKMELATITEAISYVVNDPMNVIGKLGDAVKEFGSRIESEFRSATSGGKSADGNQGGTKASTGPGRRRSSPKNTAPPAV